MRYLTAESVTIGHPDKMADIIADSILTECLKQDPESRVACEVLLTAHKCIIAGEITTEATVNHAEVARTVIEEIGYSTENLDIEVCLHEQSPDIAAAVDYDVVEHGAGDQGIVYGYATDETTEMLPLPFLMARYITMLLQQEHRQNPTVRPDGKAQVTIEYSEDGERHLEAVVTSAQHIAPTNGLTLEMIKNMIKRVAQTAVMYCSSAYPVKIDDDTDFFINPSGQFIVGGFEADTGLTGRKLMVDTYGGLARHGGGAFSGKDPSKLDRSGAYMARYIAKNIVAAGLARRCEVSLAYAIGYPRPVAIDVDTFGTGEFHEDFLIKLIYHIFPLTPIGIIEHLGLQKVDYKDVAIQGAFGCNDFPWEKTDCAKTLKELALSWTKAS